MINNGRWTALLSTMGNPITACHAALHYPHGPLAAGGVISTFVNPAGAFLGHLFRQLSPTYQHAPGEAILDSAPIVPNQHAYPALITLGSEQGTSKLLPTYRSFGVPMVKNLVEILSSVPLLLNLLLYFCTQGNTHKGGRK